MLHTTSISEYKDLIDKFLVQLLPKSDGEQETLFEAMRYSLLGDGKRIRPILTLCVTDACGTNIQHALQPACALELIHTYSLIHDDLPCMDDDDFRRGKPSCHKAFTEAHAVLAGDCLLTFAFELLADAPHLSSDQKIELVKYLSQNSGGHGMIGGQVIDIESEGKKIDLNLLQKMHALKTGALIKAAILFGGIIADVTQEHLAILKSFGEKIGLAFQIKDDLLEGFETESDRILQKATFLSLLGTEQANLLAQRLVDSAIGDLHTLPYNTEKLEHLASLILA